MISRRATEWDRAILHADMDAFFAAVEILDDPSLEGKPVIVGGTPEGRGVVSTCSYEARKFGVHSAMSAWQAVKLCPQGIFLRPRGSRYREVSHQIFSIFRDYTPLVEGLSCDEAFMDVTGCQRLFGAPEDIARQLKGRVRDELGLTVSVGVAANKFLAKLGSDLRKPDGLVVIRPETARAFIAPLEVSRIPGIGKTSLRSLERIGVRLIGDLFRCSPGVLQACLGSHAATVLCLARGEDEREVVPWSAPKSISAERTFAEDIGDPAELRRRLDALVDEVAGRLREEGYLGRTLQLKARFPDFKTLTRSMTLEQATNSTRQLTRLARELLESRLNRQGTPLRLIGFGVSNLSDGCAEQLQLFRRSEAEREEKIDAVVDRVRAKLGKDAIVAAGRLERPPGK